MIRSQSLAAALAILAMSAAWAPAGASETSKVMGSIDVGAGEHAGELSTVNGSINIGENAVVGSAHTVNCSIELQSQASAAELKTVNGSIRLRHAVRVSGDVQTVNGKVRLEDGPDVGGQLHNVNGGIRIEAAHVGGGLHTSTGNIQIGPDARIEGGVHMEKSEGWTMGESTPCVVVAAGSVVHGTLRFDRPVKLYVSEHATIGPVEGATAVRFAGSEPSD